MPMIGERESEGAGMHGQGCLEQLVLPLYQPPICPERLHTEEKTTRRQSMNQTPWKRKDEGMRSHMLSQ